ncbi:MAG: hypothetical protein ABFS56_02530 [Pseudomonadota bacterium]
MAKKKKDKKAFREIQQALLQPKNVATRTPIGRRAPPSDDAHPYQATRTFTSSRFSTDPTDSLGCKP